VFIVMFMFTILQEDQELLFIVMFMFTMLQEELEIVFMVVFTTEMMTKILALGFVLHKEQSPSNCRHVKLNVNRRVL
jgi:hypothetical protein